MMDTQEDAIPEKDAAVPVYRRDGNRSKTASSALAEPGCTNICEFGGVKTWPSETEPQSGGTAKPLLFWEDRS